MKAVNWGVKFLGFLMLSSVAVAGQFVNDIAYDQKNAWSLFDNVSNIVAKQVIAAQSDGSAVIVGTFFDKNAQKYELILVRYAVDGTLDRHFGSGGIVVTALACGVVAKAVAVQASGNIIVAADYKSDALCQDIILISYKPNGSLDTSFGGGLGYVFAQMKPVCEVNTLTICPDGKLIIGGWYCDGEQPLGGILLMRFLSNGTPDITFGIDGCIKNHICGRAASLCALKTMVPGCVLAAGIVLRDDYGQAMVMKWRTNGRVDCLFGGGAGYVLLPMIAKNIEGAVAFVFQGENILVAGNHFDVVHERNVIILSRILPDGTLDTSFGEHERGMALVAPNAGDVFVQALGLLNDGSIMLVCLLSDDSKKRTVIMHLNNQGTLDFTAGQRGMANTIFACGGASGIAFADSTLWMTGAIDNKETPSMILAKYAW